MKHFEITDICHGCVKVGRNGRPKSWTRGGKFNSKHAALLWGSRQNRNLAKLGKKKLTGRQVGNQNTQ